MCFMILRRLAAAVIIAWLGATLTFVVVQAVPGSYADRVAAAKRLPEEQRAALEHRYGLDQPAHVQYLRWLGALVQGDLGYSFLFQRPVGQVVRDAIGPTLLLTVPALLLNLGLGFVLALAAVYRPHGWLDRFIAVLSLGVYGMPSFWLAGLVILVFSLYLGWLPASHMFSVGAEELSAGGKVLDLLRHLVLPAGCLGLVGAAVTGRYLRAALLELRDARFLQAARARGLPESRVLLVHALRPALLPVVTLLGLALPSLVSGSVVVETVFSWPGMGRVLWLAATANDVPVLLGVTMTGMVAVVVGNMVADLLYAVVDPRAREER